MLSQFLGTLRIVTVSSCIVQVTFRLVTGLVRLVSSKIAKQFGSAKLH